VETTRPSLLLRLRDRGDREAWSTFDVLYRPLLYRYARQRGLGHDDAEDVTQACLESISDHIGRFDYDPRLGRFKAWLRTLVNNRVRNQFRRKRERPVDPAALPAEPEDDATPDQAFEQVWLQEHLWHCLADLKRTVDPTTFAAFVAYVIEEQPAEEVCGRFNLQPNNLYTIKWRLTQKVAERMRELTDDDAAE